MAHEIGDRKLAYVDETKHFVEIEDNSFALIFYDLESNHMNDIDACRVSIMWVG